MRRASESANRYIQTGETVKNTQEDHNKALVLEAFETLFNRHDFAAAERFWSQDYIQHSAVIPPGRDGLFGYVEALPMTVKYERQVITAGGDVVMVHGRFSGEGLTKAIVSANIVRIENGLFVEHWEVLQDEVTQSESKSGQPMFGSTFPS